jgi:uncharacterized LabA/DUF88 family protein
MAESFVLYVDGFNLYHGLHAKTGRAHLWLDLVALARSLRPRSKLVAVRYFTAPVLNDPAAASRQSDYIGALAAHSGADLEIVQGRYQAKQMACRTCGVQWTKYEEKETDVNIAVSLVADAASGSIDAALLLSADSDLAPAVRVARRLNPQLFITAAFPPNRHSAELKKMMPNSFQIGISKIKSAQLPATVTDPARGLSWSRPAKWT